MKVEIFDGQITKNFNIKEFACRANNEMLINEEVIEHIKRLQEFRESMKVNSGFRTVEHNKKVGGSPTSQHLKGIACDIALPSEFFNFSKQRQDEFYKNIKSKWFSLCQNDGLGGDFDMYNTFLHFDSRKNRSTWIG